MTTKSILKYAGAGWVKSALNVAEMSPLGEKVADILGQAWSGIYHVDAKLERVDWKSNHHISVCVRRVNSYELAVISMECKAREVIVEIRAASPTHLKLMFWNRE